MGIVPQLIEELGPLLLMQLLVGAEQLVVVLDVLAYILLQLFTLKQLLQVLCDTLLLPGFRPHAVEQV